MNTPTNAAMRPSAMAKAAAYDKFMDDFDAKLKERPLPADSLTFQATAILLDYYARELDAAQPAQAGEAVAERWVTQDRFFDPEQPLNVCTGNCTESALASILGIALSEVPSFYGLQSSDYWDALDRFVNSRGFWLARMDGNYVPEGLYLADGPSERGCGHFVVMRNGELAHDPHPSRAGLKAIEHVWMLVPLDPALHPQPEQPASAKDIALALDWLRTQPDKTHAAVIEEALAAYDPAKVGARTVVRNEQPASAVCERCDGEGEITNCFDAIPCPVCQQSPAVSPPSVVAVSEDFEATLRPVVQWLNANGNPHMTILVTTTGAELVSGQQAFETLDYVRG